MHGEIVLDHGRLLAGRNESMLDQVTSRDYILAMKTAGIRELKARLSEYVRQVTQGEVVLITDRGRVVAELRRPGPEQGALTLGDLRLHQAVERGLIRPSPLRAEDKERAVERLLKGAPGPWLPKGSAQRILDEIREERS